MTEPLVLQGLAYSSLDFSIGCLPIYVEILGGRDCISLFDLTRLAACIFNASQSGNFESSTDPIDPKKGYAPGSMERLLTVWFLRG
jgi:hypothetical protein